MNQKVQKTAGKTLEALARIERFIEKYGPDIDKELVAQIARKLKEIQKKTDGLID